MSKFLTKDSIASDGVLIVRKIKDFACDHVFIYGCFRMFYTLDGGPCSPQELTDRNADSVPDYIESMLYKLETARALLTESFHFKDPLANGFFYGQGARYIDVYLRDIPRQHGLASGMVFDEFHEILAGTPFQGKSLKITLHRDLRVQTETPLHELFHLFQYNYSQFNNPWFMEGLGRWSQRIVSNHSGKEEKLPSSASELDELLNKSHEAEYFWNRLSSLCDTRGTFDIPDHLGLNDEIANNVRPGGNLVRTILEYLERQCHLIKDEAILQQQSSPLYWPRAARRSPENNKYIFQAICAGVNACTDVKSKELISFLDTIRPFIGTDTADFDTPVIQSFMQALGKCSQDYVRSDTNGTLYSDRFDPLTRTLSVETVNCSSPRLVDADLETFSVVKHVNGNLHLDNFNITRLEGFSNIESITGNLKFGNSGIECIEGFCKLRLAGGIILDGMKDLVRVSGFSSLRFVASTINICNNPKLASISGFNSLEECETLEISGNDTLKTISGFNQIGKLTGDLRLNQCKRLTQLSGLSALSFVHNILIAQTGLSDASSLRNVFKSTPEFPGYIKITSNNLSSVSFMQGLRSVASSFYLHQNRLRELTGLGSLESIGASFSLGSNLLSDISQLSNLTRIGGVLSLSDNHLTSLHGLENLQSIKTTLWNGVRLTIKFQNNTYPDGRISLLDISALANVVEVSRDLIIQVDPHHAYDLMPRKGSAYCANRITYCSNAAGESGTRSMSEVVVDPVPRSSPEDARIASNGETFLHWESMQAERYEYLNAGVLATKVATCQHATVSLNIAAWLSNHFRNTRFSVHMAHMKLYVEAVNAFFYPDLFVTRIESAQAMQRYLKDPLLIVEVLSEDTQAYDRSDKFSLYRKITGLREYILIDPDERRVEYFCKNAAGHWELKEHPAGADLEFGCLEVAIPASEVFAHL